MLNIVVPMAGAGSRFKEAGYKKDKPLIDVDGKTMIERVVENLKPDVDHKFIFIIREEQKEKLEPILDGKIVTLPGMTEGAACSILAAVDEIDNKDELMLANCDQVVDIDITDFVKEARKHDASIMTFYSDHPKWSYAKVKNGRVTEVKEKEVISKHATVGIYYFKRGQDFVESAYQMITKEIRVNGEFYTCPVYNEMLDKDISIYEITEAQMHGMGVPDDLEEYVSYLRHSR